MTRVNVTVTSLGRYLKVGHPFHIQTTSPGPANINPFSPVDKNKCICKQCSSSLFDSRFFINIPICNNGRVQIPWRKSPLQKLRDEKVKVVGVICGVYFVLTSTNNLCFEQKYEKISDFLSETFHFLVVKFSIYLNRLVFVMWCLHFSVSSFCLNIQSS